MAARKRDPLRTVRAHLTHASSPLEPIQALLECGHVVRTTSTTQRARCPLCRKRQSLRQAQARIRHALVTEAIEAGAEAVYVCVDRTMRASVEKVKGYRVLSVRVLDVTPGNRHGERLACEALTVACDARGIEYVRAKLMEMAEALDGAVIVT